MQWLNLALQGGGSHGAFTWGVLDALLEQETIAFEGISGASAGALNAVALASGWATAVRAGTNPHTGARETLRAVWDDVVALGAYGEWTKKALRTLTGSSPVLSWPALMPINPLGINPLRQVLQQRIDFDAIRDTAMPRVYVSATQVRSGRATIFSGDTLTLEAVLASACLPMLFQAVEIEGEAYWDGGYAVNPPLAPFLRDCASADVLLVQINPVTRDEVPRAAGDIVERINELTFNAGLLSQVRAVQHVNQLIDAGVLRGAGVFKVLLHRIDGGAVLARFAQSTRVDASAALLRELFELGRVAGLAWWDAHRDDVGVRGTIDFGEYEDDTWLKLFE